MAHFRPPARIAAGALLLALSAIQVKGALYVLSVSRTVDYEIAAQRFGGESLQRSGHEDGPATGPWNRRLTDEMTSPLFARATVEQTSTVSNDVFHVSSYTQTRRDAPSGTAGNTRAYAASTYSFSFSVDVPTRMEFFANVGIAYSGDDIGTSGDAIYSLRSVIHPSVFFAYSPPYAWSGTLEPGLVYTFVASTISDSRTSSFPTRNAGVDVTADATFRVVPAPGSAAVLGVALGAVARRKRRVPA